MMLREQFSQLMAPGMHHAFVHWLDMVQREMEFDKIFNIEDPGNTPFVDEVEFAGLPPMPVKEEGSSTIYSDAIQGGSKRYLHFTYALGVRASWELHEDDQYGIIMQVPKALARSAHFTKELQAFNVFNFGFATTVQTSLGLTVQITTTDGVSLFNNQHPLLGGTAATNIAPGITNVISAAGTYPNRPATDVDLSITALQLAMNHFERMPDSQGMPSVLKPRTLLIPPELKWIAQELLGSSHKPYTNDNEINAILSEDLNYFVGHYLTSQSAWFLLCDKSSHQLKYFDRKALFDDFSDDFDTRSVKQLSIMRFSVGATSWLGTWGSNGP